jgi:hypothetical protein
MARTADEARAQALAAQAARPTAFAQMSSGLGIGANVYSNKDQFLSYLQTTDPVQKSEYLQEINRNLGNTRSTAPGFDGSELEYLQTLMRRAGFSKAKTPIGGGMIGPGDAAGLDTVIALAYASNLDPLTYLENYNQTLAGKTVKQPDTTTRYSKQIQTALQFKDLGDARQYYSDSYFAAYGVYPSADLDKKFQDSWNAQIQSQDKPTTTKTKIEKAPIYDKKAKPLIDKKTGEQKKDKFGNLIYVDKSGKPAIAKDKNGVYRYTDVITGQSTSGGEGFTPEEQQQFLATFLSENFPGSSFNVDDVGGAAKTIYDSIVELHKANYTKPPAFSEVSGLIKNMLGSPDEKVQTELYTQYSNDIQAQALTRFNGLSAVVKPGENANKYIAPVLKTLSESLEKEVTIDSDIAKEIFNFKGEDGSYRMPNDFELLNYVKARPEYGRTSMAINESVNVAQALKNALG